MVYGGYSDWYLPAKDELNILYSGSGSVGGFIASTYWSSTEYNLNNFSAWYQSFTYGTQYYSKTIALSVRCIRKI